MPCHSTSIDMTAHWWWRVNRVARDWLLKRSTVCLSQYTQYICGRKMWFDGECTMMERSDRRSDWHLCIGCRWSSVVCWALIIVDVVGGFDGRVWKPTASREDRTPDPWFTRPVLYHWAIEARISLLKQHYRTTSQQQHLSHCTNTLDSRFSHSFITTSIPRQHMPITFKHDFSSSTSQYLFIDK